MIPPSPYSRLEQVSERVHEGTVILRPKQGSASRRVLFINCYGGAELWQKIKRGEAPSHHLWGCVELAAMGYEVAIGAPLPDFYLHRNPLPHDLRCLGFARSWLRPDDIVFCGHNVLFWLPLAKQLRLLRVKMVSLLYGREPLSSAGAHDGIIALNRAAEEQARKIAPGAYVRRLAWGVDLSYFPRLPYSPEAFLSCGRSGRDFLTLQQASKLVAHPLTILAAGNQELLKWPTNVSLIETGAQRIVDHLKVSFSELLHSYYATCTASLVVLKRDPAEVTGVGFTSIIEAMAMGRPVVATRTGATPTEIDVEAVGCGLNVPPDDPVGLASAMNRIAADPGLAEQMGQRGRELCAGYYNSERFSRELNEYFLQL